MAATVRSEASTSQDELIWEPQPKQASFITCPADDVGFGGARGGGKSDGVIGDWIDHEETYGQHAIGLAFRRARTQLVELIERAKVVLTPLGYRWHEQDKYFRGPKGGRLRFSFLESDSDADAYQGHGYTRIYPEEMGTFPTETPINKLMATLRSGQGVPCQMKATFNPGGPGHQWVKRRYQLDTYPKGYQLLEFEFENPFTKRKVKKNRLFIPSRVVDNKYLGDDYVANLHMVGSPTLVRAWLEGDWNVIEGAFFPEFSEARHVITPFAIPDDWLRYRSMDWGSASPFCCLWWAVVGDNYQAQENGMGRLGVGYSGLGLPRGALVCYREWYGSPDGHASHTGLKLTAEEVAKGIVSRETAAKELPDSPRKIAYGVLDPSAFAQDGGPSHAERMARPPHKVFFRPADNKRVTQRGAMGGWDQVRARLIGTATRGANNAIDWSTGQPMIYFFDTCIATIGELPGLQHDPDKPEDVDTEGIDHASDSVRYACMARPFVRTIEPPVRIPMLSASDTNTMTLNDLWDEEQMRRGYK